MTDEARQQAACDAFASGRRTRYQLVHDTESKESGLSLFDGTEAERIHYPPIPAKLGALCTLGL